MRPEKYPRETTVSNLPHTNVESKVNRWKGWVQDSQWKPRLETVLWTPARALSTMGLTSLPPVTASERWGGEPVLFQDFQSMKRYLRLSQGHRPAEKSQPQLRCIDCLSRARRSPRLLCPCATSLSPCNSPAGLVIISSWRPCSPGSHQC